MIKVGQNFTVDYMKHNTNKKGGVFTTFNIKLKNTRNSIINIREEGNKNINYISCIVWKEVPIVNELKITNIDQVFVDEWNGRHFIKAIVDVEVEPDNIEILSDEMNIYVGEDDVPF